MECYGENMAVQDKSLNPLIFASAREEFLKKGFSKASLKEICKNAGVTTGALYKRYKGKEDLFDAVVQPIYENMKIFGQKRVDGSSNMIEEENPDFWVDMEQQYVNQVNEFYDMYDDMRLLLVCSEGTKHSNFLHVFAEQCTEHSYYVAKLAYENGLSEKLVAKDLLHTCITAYTITIFEPIIHGYSREKAIEHAKVIANFFNWNEVLDF